MTKITDKESKRKKAYNFLDKKGTTRTRHDYIETGYVDGVKDANGNQVMRPLDESERAWLSKFVSETEHCNMTTTKQIKLEVRKLKSLRADYRAASKAANIDEMERLFLAIDAQLQVCEYLREDAGNFYTTEEDVKGFYTRDNERRRDVYNNAKISDNLTMFTPEEYDKFSTEAINDVNHEDLILEHIVYVPKGKKKK